MNILPTKNSLYVYGAIAVCWAFYVFFSLTTPLNESANSFKISFLTLTILKLTIALPYLFVWLVAAYGVLCLKSYIGLIFENVDGKAFQIIWWGLVFLLVLLVLPTMFSTIFGRFATPGTVAVVLVPKFITIFLLLLSFLALYFGSRRLIKNVGAKLSLAEMLATVNILVLITGILLWVFFTDPKRDSAYFMPAVLAVVIFIIPTVVSWTFGLLAVFNLRKYQQKAPGLVYQTALPFWVWGIILIIAASVFLQFLTLFGSTRLLAVGLGAILILVYLLILLQGIGYFLLARGCSRLARVQSVLSDLKTAN